MRAGRLVRITLGIVAAVGGYVLLLRPRMLRWGTTPEERERRMPGDELVERPRWSMTLATTIQAPPERIWPWLVQIGYQRGGLYSYDRLDRLFGFLDRPSADRILPEFQHLEAGDVIPLGSGPDWPVATVEPGRALVLAPEAPGMTLSWAFALYPLDALATRLVTRVRADFEATPRVSAIMVAMDPAAFLMTRKMLLGIRQRAEGARA